MNHWQTLSTGRPFAQRNARQWVSLLVAWLAVLWTPLVPAAVSNLGELLDSGAIILSPEDFRNELVGHVIVGPAQSAIGLLELVYLENGMLVGKGTSTRMAAFATAEINGTWKTDADGKRICTSMRMGGAMGAVNGVELPSRCQVWFKFADRYFVADSETDRSAKVLDRTVKR
jgi:hypothetical protein